MYKRVFERIVIAIIFFFFDLRDRIKRKKYKKDIIINPFTKKVCCVLALYEKQYLRKDILSLLKILKEKNIDVIGVNTKKIDNPEEYSELFTLYIERDNYGRDFASYKVGVEEVYSLKNQKDILFDRVIILNDSVFYSQNKLEDFIKNLSIGKEEVIGATENYEVYRHIGSFCLSLSKNIFYHPKIENYWKQYKLTNTRPKVIKTGELALSRTLFSLVEKGQIKILFDYKLVQKNMNASTGFLKDYIFYRRADKDKHDKPKTFEKIIDGDAQLKQNYYSFALEKVKEKKGIYFTKKDHSVDKKILNFFIFEEDIIYEYIDSLQEEKNFGMRRKLYSILLSETIRGSQIHLNCLVFAMLGLPIIKLDLLFRNVINLEDLNKYTVFLDKSDYEHLESLLMQRPCGFNTLIGLDLLAYRNGYL